LACDLVNIETDADFLAKADRLMHTFWDQSQPPTPTLAASQKAELQLTKNEALLAQKEHYLGAMIYYEGEWYWGVDRLDHLEQRLIDTGLARQPREQIHFNKTYAQFCQRPAKQISAAQNISQQPLVLYWSARSPYSYIGLEQATKLAKYYHIPLVIKPVLPMMMRGMHVPETKKMYIFLDTKREARKLGIPYGFVADPLGAAVERCYALVEYAQSENKLHQFLLSFARGVNAEGIRAETDSGLKKIVTRCGLDWSVAKSKLSDRHWQNWAQDNLDEMLLMGCWGVPSIRYGNTHFWGQDRFGMIENAIRKELETKCILRTG
jgi:2-hydroxychromene-2-carboxylate isomerase